MEHLEGVLNVQADGLRFLGAAAKTLVRMFKEVYAVDKLDRDNNKIFPIVMRLVKAEQDKDTTLLDSTAATQ